MSERISASICINDLFDASKSLHSSVSLANNGKKYAQVVIWINDNKDKYGNDVSIQLNSSQEKRETEPKIYIGNGKSGRLPALPDNLAPKPDQTPLATDDLPF